MTNNIDINLLLKDKEFIAGMEKALGKASAQTKTATSKMSKSWKDHKKTIIAATAAIGGLMLSVKSLYKIYAVQEEAELRMAAALKSTGQNVGIVGDYYKNLASQIQDVTSRGDEEILGMMETLIRFGHVSEENMNRAVHATINWARSTHKDLQAAAFDLSKAFAGNAMMITRYGIQVSKADIKTRGAVAVIKALEKSLRGVETAFTSSVSGSFAQAGNLFGDINEKLGSIIIKYTKLATATDSASKNTWFLTDALKAMNYALGDYEQKLQDAIVAENKRRTAPPHFEEANITKDLAAQLLGRKSLLSVYFAWASRQFKKYNEGQKAMAAAEEGRLRTEYAMTAGKLLTEADAIVKQITADEEKHTEEMRKQAVLSSAALAMQKKLAEANAAAARAMKLSAPTPEHKNTGYADSGELGDLMGIDMNPAINKELEQAMRMSDILDTLAVKMGTWRDVYMGATADMAGALFDLAVAHEMTAASIGDAMRKVTQSILRSLAQEASAMMIKEFAIGVSMWPMGHNHFKSAALWGLLAGGAIVAGGALGSGSSAGGTGGASASGTGGASVSPASNQYSMAGPGWAAPVVNIVVANGIDADSIVGGSLSGSNGRKMISHVVNNMIRYGDPAIKRLKVGG